MHLKCFYCRHKEKGYINEWNFHSVSWKLHHVLCPVSCTLCPVLYVLYTVSCPLYFISCILYSLSFIHHYMSRILFPVFCILNPVCNLCILHPCILFWTVFPVFCIFHPAFCSLHPVLCESNNIFFCILKLSCFPSISENIKKKNWKYLFNIVKCTVSSVQVHTL